jgi:DNA invertase Pin-like site-specific DNA recombinase
VRFGPRPSLAAEQIAHARQLIEGEGKPVVEVARLLGVHRATLYRALDDNSVADEMRSSLQKS